MSNDEWSSSRLNRGTTSFGDRSTGARSTARPKTRPENAAVKSKPGGEAGNGNAKGATGPKHRKHRPQSPGLKWHKDYSEIDPQCGRVLVIDFVKQDKNKVDVRKVAAREIFNLDKLRKVYSEPDATGEAVLRVFHVQNAPWATLFLLRKFNIYNKDDIVGTDFGRYVKHKRPERRGGKPFLSGKTWKVRHDPWRGISATSFGLDYLKHYKVPDPINRTGLDDSEKMMELNCYNADDNPVYGYDVYVQRVSCYVQHKELSLEVPDSADIENPYHRPAENGGTDGKDGKDKEYFPKLSTLDNGNAILIFDNSHTGSIADTLIAARQSWESRWRRLPFYLALEARDMMATDEQLSYQCSKIIIEDIFKGLVMAWDGFLDLAMDHVSILEDKIYEQPADETRAPELWANSSLWLKVEKLMFLHIDIVKEMSVRLDELTDDDPDGGWLDDTPGDFDRLANYVTEDLVKPTETLISLLYQSVSIRDSRHSIQLGVSMWRLSWITFIFLPLTFITGFFGMNVDTFAENPSIKWYFVSSVPFMTCIMASWYIMKHALARERQTPYQRGIYESFFHDMATNNPTLWSRVGPRDYVQPKGRLDKIKWLLIRRWSVPEKTIKPTTDREGRPEDDLGIVSKLKRYLTKRWTSQIQNRERLLDTSLSLEYGDDGSDADITVPSGLASAIEVLSAPATDSMAATRLAVPEDTRNRQPLAPEWPEPEDRTMPSTARRSRRRSRSRSRSSAGRSSGVLIEEENWYWLHDQGTEGKWVWRSSSSRDISREKSRSPPGSPPPPPFKGRGSDDSKRESWADNQPGNRSSIDAVTMARHEPTEPESRV